MRTSKEVIDDIKSLTNSKGYIYALCLILYEDFHWELNKLHEIDYRSILSVKECSLILGFIVQNSIDFSLPESPEEVIRLKEKTYELMKELQTSFTEPQFAKFREVFDRQRKDEKIIDSRDERIDLFVKDRGMVEPMFYAGDGVYDLQYLEYLQPKYKYDSEWLKNNRQFNLQNVVDIAVKIKRVLGSKRKDVTPLNLKALFPKIVNKAKRKVIKKVPTKEIEEAERHAFVMATFFQYSQLFPNIEKFRLDENKGWSVFYENLLNLFIVTPSDLEGIEQRELDAFFSNFSFVPGCNHSYEGPGCFNILNSRPLIKLLNDRYFVPITYLISEAIYESPFYWMWDDKPYRDALAKHRGDVGEEIAFDFLTRVFGVDHTIRSVKIEAIKGKPQTDIDILCLLGNIALCVQVKSKKLTLSARRGDFDQLLKDFNGAVQDAYDQGLVSRRAILSKDARFYDRNGDEIFLPTAIRDVYIMGLTTENYPSLVHQVHMMLKKENTDPYPLFLSIFDLELLSHYLKDPYDFLYYVRQRIDLSEYFRADEEIAYLGYHLHRKLCRIDGYDWGTIDTDFGGLIDRNYYPHKAGLSHLVSENDDPIHNRWKDPRFDLLISELKLAKHSKATDIIFHLFDLSGESRKNIVGQMVAIKRISQNEQTTKSLATAIPPDFGMSYTVLNGSGPDELSYHVTRYTKLRKYLSKCNAWLGMGAFSNSANLVDFIIYEDELWHVDLALEKEHEEILAKMKNTPLTSLSGSRKLGRNDPCHCGSQKKYKKCCG